MHERHEAVLGQLGLTPVADRDLGRALHIHAAVVGRERVSRQAFDRATRFDAADARAPAVHLERAVDVHGHRVGSIRPRVPVVVGSAGVFLEIELLDRAGLGSVGQPRQIPGHRQAEVARVLRLAQRPPRRILGRREDLGEVARIGQLLPALHLHDRRRCAGNEGSVRGRGDLGHLAEQLDVGRASGRSSSRRRGSRTARRRTGRTPLRRSFLKSGLWSQAVPLYRFSVLPRSCLLMFMKRILSISSVSVLLTR